MRELEKGASEAAVAPDESELKQQEMDDVTGGNNGASVGGPIGPHH